MKKHHLNGDPVREAELTNRGINFAFYDRVGNSLSSLPFLADFSEAWAARLLYNGFRAALLCDGVYRDVQKVGL